MECWNIGIMEYWVLKADDVLILFSDKCNRNKNRSHSAKTQYSSIPLFHYPRAFDYGHPADGTDLAQRTIFSLLEEKWLSCGIPQFSPASIP
jgi:hypothetical protein